MCLNSERAAENSSSVDLMCQSIEPPISKNRRTFTALWRSGRIRISRYPLCAVPLMVPSRSSSSGAPVRANLRKRRSAILILRAELDVAGEILEFAFVPDLHRAEIAVLVLTNAHALRIVTVGAERRSARRADPLLAALMAAALFGEPLPQYFEKPVETA